MAAVTRSSPAKGPPLEPLASALLDAQQAARRARAEARSLTPESRARVAAHAAAERAVEENLARGRALTRDETRRATRPVPPLHLGRARFPRAECIACAPIRMVLWGTAALFSPFALYFLMIALILI